MDSMALQKIGCGLYLISTTLDGQDCGCVANTLMQVTASPVKLAITLNKENCTEQMMEKSGVFAAVALSEEADMDLIGEFGFKKSCEVNKFRKFPHRRDEAQVPYVTAMASARMSCKIVDRLDLGTHVMFIGELTEAEVLSPEAPMTYGYYHEVKKGTTPKNAPSYREESGKGYQCSICGYHLESDIIPEGFVCPICGMGPDKLVKL
ncbi:flavin reductase [Zongyangia hominis]|uniref:Flavin reductase n=1 Tax=Zongyangia hominis TaxID=2763677 RepID=A0A926I6M5_9FIRM|nr:flavin reductase [Zongyangia hominis]MBC8570209.1 flavin reductase [Zongyangia hominis]